MRIIFASGIIHIVNTYQNEGTLDIPGILCCCLPNGYWQMMKQPIRIFYIEQEVALVSAWFVIYEVLKDIVCTSIDLNS